MMTQEKSPRAWRRRGQDERNQTPSILGDRPPVCKLHSARIVFRFPEACPYSEANPLARLYEMRERGWGQLADRSTEEHRGGLTLLDVVDVCVNCIDRLLGDKHVRLLRERIGYNG